MVILLQVSWRDERSCSASVRELLLAGDGVGLFACVGDTPCGVVDLGGRRGQGCLLCPACHPRRRLPPRRITSWPCHRRRRQLMSELSSRVRAAGMGVRRGILRRRSGIWYRPAHMRSGGTCRSGSRGRASSTRPKLYVRHSHRTSVPKLTRKCDLVSYDVLDMTRFPTADHLVSWAGLALSPSSSIPAAETVEGTGRRRPEGLLYPGRQRSRQHRVTYHRACSPDCRGPLPVPALGLFLAVRRTRRGSVSRKPAVQSWASDHSHRVAWFARHAFQGGLDLCLPA